MSQSPQDNQKYWKDYAIGPKYGEQQVSRPDPGGAKQYTMAFDGHNNDQKWSDVRDMTVQGKLGHYSARSPDGKAIAVHYDPSRGAQHIESQLRSANLDVLSHPYDGTFKGSSSSQQSQQSTQK